MSAELAVLQQIKNRKNSYIGEVREFETNLETFTVDGETWMKNGNFIESSNALAKTVDIGAWTGVTSAYVTGVGSGQMAEDASGNVLVVPAGIKVVYSTNGGTSWMYGGSLVNNVTKVVFGNGIFVAILAGTTADNRIYTSTDGITWTARTSVNADHYDISFGDGVFYVACNGYIYTSTDGITWTNRTSGTYFSISYIKEKNLWIAVNATTIAILNGAKTGNITTYAVATQFASGTGSIFYFDGYIYTFSVNGNTPVFFRSTDGSVWTRFESTKLSFLSQGNYYVYHVNGLLVFTLSSTSPFMLYSADLVNFYATETIPLTVIQRFFVQQNGTCWITGNSGSGVYLAKAQQIKGFALPFDGSKKFMRVA